MNKCEICEGASNVRLVPEYRADLLGAPFDVVLIDAVKQKYCEGCGDILETSIPDLEGLLHTVAATRAAVARKLSGAEIRFLRHAMGWKAKEVAEKLDMTPQNFSRVENNNKLLGPQSEKLFRIYVIAKAIEKGEMESEIARKIADLCDLKIETFWDVAERLELRFERVNEQPSGCDDTDSGKWARPKEKQAA